MPDIYVVDDNASFRTAIQLTLEKTGYRVVTCASAQQLLDQRPAENAVGCILLDVRMPCMSGPELQSRLTALGWTLPIVFLTGYTDISITVKAIKAGADNVLIKPVSEDELLRAIEVAIARHETERVLRGELQALRARLSTLTPRQRQIFEIIVQGKTNKLVARELGSSERTIKAHSGFPDRAALHFSDEVEDVPADAARTSCDARGRPARPDVPSEIDGEAVIASGGGVCRKRAFPTELVRTNTSKAKVIVRKNCLHGDLRFHAFEVNKFRRHYSLLSFVGSI